MVFATGVVLMHCRGMVDQDLHTNNTLLPLSGYALVKADLGNAMLKEVDGHPTSGGHHVGDTCPFARCGACHTVALKQCCTHLRSSAFVTYLYFSATVQNSIVVPIVRIPIAI